MPTALITGAGRGIGLTITERLAGRGWNVIAGARSEGHLEHLATITGVRPIKLDITKARDVEALTTLLPDRLDALVNNAGRVIYGPVEAVPIDELAELMDLNVTSQIAVTQAALPALRTAQGRIAFISSMSGLMSIPWSGPYSASKFALEALADSLRIELQQWNIRVSLIEPGTTDTDIWKGASSDLDDMAASMPAEYRRLYDHQLICVRRLLPLIRKGAIARAGGRRRRAGTRREAAPGPLPL